MAKSDRRDDFYQLRVLSIPDAKRSAHPPGKGASTPSSSNVPTNDAQFQAAVVEGGILKMSGESSLPVRITSELWNLLASCPAPWTSYWLRADQDGA